jgi:hypothetical protein
LFLFIFEVRYSSACRGDRNATIHAPESLKPSAIIRRFTVEERFYIPVQIPVEKKASVNVSLFDGKAVRVSDRWEIVEGHCPRVRDPISQNKTSPWSISHMD